MSDSVVLRYIVRGSVQGVGFRYFVHRAASELGVQGTVRNLDDGSVEVIAAGTPDQHSRLSGRLHIGPPGASVRGVEQQQLPMQHHSSFAIAH